MLVDKENTEKIQEHGDVEVGVLSSSYNKQAEHAESGTLIYIKSGKAPATLPNHLIISAILVRSQ